MTSDMRDLQLPEDLCRKAEQQFGSRFGAIENLLVSILQQLVGEEAVQMDAAEQQVIEQRLKDLGYV